MNANAEFIKKLTQVLDTTKDNEVLNYIVPGLSSFLCSKGNIRIFENTRRQEHFITPHDHRYDLLCLVLQGSVINHTYKPEGKFDYDQVDEYAISILRTKEQFKYTREYSDKGNFCRQSESYEKGDWYFISHEDIHSIVFSHTAKVLVFESAPIDKNITILEPIDKLGEVINTFVVEPWMFRNGIKHKNHNKPSDIK